MFRLSREWRRSWISADMRCSSSIWVMNNSLDLVCLILEIWRYPISRRIDKSIHIPCHFQASMIYSGGVRIRNFQRKAITAVTGNPNTFSLLVPRSLENCVRFPKYFASNPNDDVIMGAIASQITSLTTVHSSVYSSADQSKHQSSASLALVWGLHRGPVNSSHKWPVTRKNFPFDDVIMRIIQTRD